MYATATEVKQNFGKYLSLAQKESVLITKNGHVVAELSEPRRREGTATHALRGEL